MMSPVEAGRWPARNFARVAAYRGKWSSRVRYCVILTRSVTFIPAAPRISTTFCHATSVCSSTVDGSVPSLRRPIWPATCSQRAFGGTSTPWL